MQKILCYALALAALAYGADSAATTKKSAAKKAPARVAASASAKKAPARPPSKAGSRSSATARKTSGRIPATTWRNRQMAPSPERYKEIQDALVAKGYLRPEDVGNGWNQASADGLKRFQGEQNIEASGKINSLSLIALGLGPKRDNNPTKPAESGPAQDR
ncbi:MAG: hypothetical protein P4L56_13835 [Candidatus Sulfopaludibacter sp.]|nr:hypothetical protein [Candidatus Sulfopaludibacter sp.]